MPRIGRAQQANIQQDGGQRRKLIDAFTMFTVADAFIMWTARGTNPMTGCPVVTCTAMIDVGPTGEFWGLAYRTTSWKQHSMSKCVGKVLFT